ncbi:DUF4421 family protein [Limibacter armeniacum]|uniref:DUF4421 family protein n=1 Tax=Limibacter armeniacum TaxID=466084 RepID=UPI002FE5E595
MKYLTLLIWSLLLLSIPHLTFSQHTDPDKENWFVQKGKRIQSIYNNFDSSYIEKTAYKYALILKSGNWQDAYNLNIEHNTNVDFKSDLNSDIGIFASYRAISLGYSVNLNDLVFGESIKRKKWEVNIANNILSLELFYFNNKGLTNLKRYSDEFGTVELPKTFKGIATDVGGIDFNYFFNNKSYSNAAAYHDVHLFKQIKSAGSLIAGASFTRHDLSFDFSEEQGLQLPQNLDKTYETYCLNIGYGYNYIFAKNWLANMSMIPAVGVQIDNSHDKQQEYITLRNKGRMAVINNKPGYFWGVKCQNITNWFFSDNYTVANTLFTFKVLYGIRL